MTFGGSQQETGEEEQEDNENPSEERRSEPTEENVEAPAQPAEAGDEPAEEYREAPTEEPRETVEEGGEPALEGGEAPTEEAAEEDPIEEGGEERETLEEGVEAAEEGEEGEEACLKAVIQIAQGEEVVPQTSLELFGDQSVSPFGAITQWEWSVEQPPGSQSLFIPSANYPNPEFEVNVAGEYIFSLTVEDETGARSCEPATANVLVIPNQAIHVELLWDTPADGDQTDVGPEAGADLDLHFTHPMASGQDVDRNGVPDGWFDQPFDCFWFNPTPEWATFDPDIDDNPSLDRDDTDGAGPENLNLDIPENGATYKVGVHYWNDHDFGPSYATIRVYISGELVYTQEDVQLIHKDMWEVCTIDWPSGTVHPIGDGEFVLPNYQNAFFFNLILHPRERDRTPVPVQV